MSEIASWLHDDENGEKGKILFCTDAMVRKYNRANGGMAEDIDWNDFTGHQGLQSCLGRDVNSHHFEGFNMPDVVRKAYLDGACDMIFSAGDNLTAMTEEFLPIALRTWQKSLKVAGALLQKKFCPKKLKTKLFNVFISEDDPWDELPGNLSIGKIICHPLIDLYTLKKIAAKSFTDDDYNLGDHHYIQLVTNKKADNKLIEMVVEGLRKHEMGALYNVLKRVKVTYAKK